MCTVTIVPKPGLKDAFRMACNRDESHGRAPADPPKHPGRKDYLDQRFVLMPIDPSSGGTWVAVNDAGIAFTLLNYNLPEPPTDRDQSRGAVIPFLAQADTVEDALAMAGQLERERMMPFRLVICDGKTLVLWRSTEPVEKTEIRPWSSEPVMFTSSGLGDHLVEGPRRELFEDWFGADVAINFDHQRDFHRHRWLDKQHVSIDMYREDARTVSYTVVDVELNNATIRYYADGPSQTAPPVTDTMTIFKR
ncbi:MAG: NRDE family protein [Planctomycetota bacterium]